MESTPKNVMKLLTPEKITTKLEEIFVRNKLKKYIHRPGFEKGVYTGMEAIIELLTPYVSLPADETPPEVDLNNINKPTEG